MNKPAFDLDPIIKERVPLRVVAEWWADQYAKRTALFNEGKGNLYDALPGSRVPHTVVWLKFPWLNPEDRIALQSEYEHIAKERRLKDFLSAVKRNKCR